MLFLIYRFVMHPYPWVGNLVRDLTGKYVTDPLSCPWVPVSVLNNFLTKVSY